MGCHFLLQGIFLTLGLNLGLLHCKQILYHLSHQGSPPLDEGELQVKVTMQAGAWLVLLANHLLWISMKHPLCLAVTWAWNHCEPSWAFSPVSFPPAMTKAYQCHVYDIFCDVCPDLFWAPPGCLASCPAAWSCSSQCTLLRPDRPWGAHIPPQSPGSPASDDWLCNQVFQPVVKTLNLLPPIFLSQ